MLMATLGRVRKLILPLGKEEEDEGVEGKTVAEGVVDHEQLDLGEVVRRDEVEEIAGEKRKEKETGEAEEEGDDGVEVKKSRKKEKKEKRSMGEAELSKGAESTPAKRPKKKRKKGDAFDDLFDSLI
jgi:ribonuclease MRP protein subunit RMP1